MCWRPVSWVFSRCLYWWCSSSRTARLWGADPIRVSAPDAAEVEFELAAPFRRVRPRRGERNFVGDWWLATTKRHVTFESWCERDHLIAFDFDPEIVGISGQPFLFRFTTASGSRRTHIPDYFLRTTQGGDVVVDIKPDNLMDANDPVNFSLTWLSNHRARWRAGLGSDSKYVGTRVRRRCGREPSNLKMSRRPSDPGRARDVCL